MYIKYWRFVTIKYNIHNYAIVNIQYLLNALFFFIVIIVT